MMGHGYYGSKLRDQESIIEKFAWTPKRSQGGKLIWLRRYFVREVYYDNNGRPPIKGLSWSFIMSGEEYFLKKLKGDL